jgi:peptidoglycan hydrolase-like protein with peptidoglycan-binding domain
MRERGWSQVAESGYYTGSPSNPCGSGLSQEVCEFQRAVMGTSGDGFVGPKTWTALWSTPVR